MRVKLGTEQQIRARDLEKSAYTGRELSMLEERRCD
jgi:hypothetical protein